MSNAPGGVSPQLSETRLLLCVIDLAGFTRLASRHSDLEVAAFLQDYYALCESAVSEASGRVIKYIGDSVMACFPAENAADAVARIRALRTEVEGLSESRGLGMTTGCNFHLSKVVEGEYGPRGNGRYDVIGSGVNHMFLMGGGPGMRISEPVYRALPNDARGVWEKKRPPATYLLRE